MEHFTNYQQMIAPAMVWESIERNDAVKMAVSFSWKNEEWLIPAVYPFPGGLVVDVVRKLPFYHCLMDTRLTDAPIELEPCDGLACTHTEEAEPRDPRFSKVTLRDYMAENRNRAAYSSLTHYPRLTTEWQFVAIHKERKNVRVKLKRD